MSAPNSPWPNEAPKSKRLTVNDTANLLAHNNHSNGDNEEVVSAQAAAGATAVMDGSGDSMAISSSSPSSPSSSTSPLIWGCSAAGVLLVLLSVSLFVAKKVRRGASMGGGGGQHPTTLGRKSDVFKAEPINEITSASTITTQDTTSKGHFKNSKSLVDVELGLQMQQQQLRDELAEEEEEAAAVGKGVSLSRNPSLLETLTSYVWPMSASPIDPPPTTAPPPVPTDTEEFPAPPDSRLVFNAAVNRDSLGSILEAPMNYEVRVSTERPKHDLRVINRLSSGQVTDGEEEEEGEVAAAKVL